MSDNPQESTEWQPSRRQKALLDAAKDITGKPTIVRLCKAAGIDRGTFYDWLDKDPDFVKAWDALWAYSIDSAMPAIVEAQIAKATGPKKDTFAATYLTNLRGKMVKRVDVTSGGVAIKGYVAVNPDDWDNEPPAQAAVE